MGRAFAKKQLILALGSSLPMVMAAPVSAQQSKSAPTADATTSPDQIAEIVVTAQKREQALSKVGISITALSGNEIAQAGIKDSMQIVNSVPNMENQSIYGPGSSTNFSIRGVAQNDYNDGTESPIATYVDEIYMVPNGAGAFPLYDMERVEVLRGPQGTLFGRNSTGGLIHFISAKPVDYFEGMLSGQIGSYRTREITGMLNVPINEHLAARVAGQYHTNAGWVHNVTGNQPDGGQIKTGSIRGQIKWTPSSTITNNLKMSYDHASGAQSGVYHEAIGINATSGDQFLLGPGQDFYGTGPQRDSNGQPNFTNRTTDNGQPRLLRGVNSTNIANRFDIKLDRLTISAVTGYNRYFRAQVEDCDGTQVRACQTQYQTRSRLFTQELRLNADFDDIKFTGGLYYLHHRLSLDNIAPLFLDTPGQIALTAVAKQISQSYAIYGNVEYQFTPELKLVVGARGSKDKKHFQQVLNVNLPCDATNPFAGYDTLRPSDVPVCGIAASNVFTDAAVGGLTRISKNTWSAKAELDFTPSPTTLIYGSISRGVKSPGFNNGFISAGLPASAFQFKSETLVAYEAGLKSQFFNRHASLSLAGFYYDYTNYDTLNYIGVGSFIDNHDAKLYGAEAELQFHPIHGLTLNASAGYTHSKLDSVANAGLVVADRQMPLAPKWTLNGMARYETEVPAIKQVVGVQIDARARANYYANPGNDSAARLPSIGVVDARIDVSNINKDYTLALVVKNAFNKRYISSIFLEQGIAGYRFGNYGMPRWFSAELTYKFR